MVKGMVPFKVAISIGELPWEKPDPFLSSNPVFRLKISEKQGSDRRGWRSVGLERRLLLLRCRNSAYAQARLA